MLLEHVRQPDKLGGAAASVFDRQSAAGRASRSKALAKSLLSCDGTASTPSGVAPAAADMTASASGKAASICFDLAEFHRHRHQFDKVPGCTWPWQQLTVTACAQYSEDGVVGLQTASSSLHQG